MKVLVIGMRKIRFTYNKKMTNLPPNIERDIELAKWVRENFLVVTLKSFLENPYEYCQCGYYDEVNEEGESVMSTCELCALKEALEALPVEGK